MQLDLPFSSLAPEAQSPEQLRQASTVRPHEEQKLEFVRVRRAKKYILRIRPDGTVRVTIPRGGSRREAEAFVSRHRHWTEQERLRVAAQHAPPEWHEGDTIALFGEPTALRVDRRLRGSWLHVGDERVPIPDALVDLRPATERALRQIAERTLIPRLLAMAADHGLAVNRITIRNQRSRWGSCSHTGVIALNFRLVQMPRHIADYVLLHELMHLRQQNHSRRFWRLVADVCPDFREAERWLRSEGRGLF